MSDPDGADDEGGGQRTKVARLIDEYGFESLGPELERRWTTDGDDRLSLRTPVDHFNQKLLADRMANAGMQPLAGEVENVYDY
jgi:hypothetical protein